MKAVLVQVPDHLLAQRKLTGADQWDEMWDGVLHMGPSPNRTHQELEGVLETWFRLHWAPTCGGKVYHQINLARDRNWTSNYRIPDLVLLTPDRFDIDHDEYFEGAPSAVVEIRSPGDESYEKLPFYAQLGVPEVWIFDRDTRSPELHQLTAAQYETQTPDGDGWFTSRLGVQFRGHSRGVLWMRLIGTPGDPSVLADI